MALDFQWYFLSDGVREHKSCLFECVGMLFMGVCEFVNKDSVRKGVIFMSLGVCVCVCAFVCVCVCV